MEKLDVKNIEKMNNIWVIIIDGKASPLAYMAIP